jgi:hypothetical protein
MGARILPDSRLPDTQTDQFPCLNLNPPLRLDLSTPTNLDVDADLSVQCVMNSNYGLRFLLLRKCVAEIRSISAKSRDTL